MADQPDSPFPFRIRRVDDPPRATPRPPAADAEVSVPALPGAETAPQSDREQVGEQEQSPPAPELSAEPKAERTDDQPQAVPGGLQAKAGRFPTPARVLAFVSTVAGSGLADEVTCRRLPEGGWWVDAERAESNLSHLVWTAGGRPYAALGDGRWQELGVEDTPSGEQLEPDRHEILDLAHLLAGTGLRPRPLASAPDLYLAVSPVLARWALKRALPLGIQVGIRLVRARPLGSDAPESPLLLLRLSKGRGLVPLALVRTLSSLPSATLARAVGPEGARLLVDVRHLAPLAESLLATLLPEEETWLLSGADTGHRSLRLEGVEVDGATLLDAPELSPGAVGDTAPVSSSEGETGPTAAPRPIPVRLAPRRATHPRVDALLLDAAELDWTRSLLMHQPLAERAFILPGPGRHLLLASDGLGSALPFGVPLHATSPGGLYLEAGLGFHPALPDDARRRVLGLDAEQVVVLTGEGAWRFQLDHLMPAWSLWVGDSPDIREDLDAQGSGLLEALDQDQRRRERDRQSAAQRLLASMRGALGRTRQATPDEARQQAILAEQQGNLLQAAELRAGVGDLADAGRLFEQAARRM